MNGMRVDKKDGGSTKIVDDNGFNPEFFTSTTNGHLTRKDITKREIFKFDISCLDMAMLTLQVWDEDATVDDFIGEAVLAVKLIRKGYRCVPLSNSVFVQNEGRLFVKFDIEISTKSF